MSELDPDGNVVRQFADPLGHHDHYHFGTADSYTRAWKHYLQKSLQKFSEESRGTDIDEISYVDIINEVDENRQLVWQTSSP
jgi:hypothetical protein